MTTCKTVCLSQLCKDRKACACQCVSWFAATSPTLVQACQAKCFNDPNVLKKYADSTSFACAEIGAQEMYNRHGVICKGFNPLTQSAQGAAYTEASKQVATQTANRRLVIWALVTLALVLAVIVYFKYK